MKEIKLARLALGFGTACLFIASDCDNKPETPVASYWLIARLAAF
jgi:hypothetical protein